VTLQTKNLEQTLQTKNTTIRLNETHEHIVTFAFMHYKELLCNRYVFYVAYSHIGMM